jgi:hypothetical protein
MGWVKIFLRLIDRTFLLLFALAEPFIHDGHDKGIEDG